MSVQRQTEYVSQDEYFDILLNGDIKYEWWGGQVWPKENPDGLPVAMAGTQPVHSDIKHNIENSLGNQLNDGPCRVRSSDQQVKIEESDLLAFPDITVVCEAPQYETVRGLETLLNPIVLVEILSPSTARFDLTDKWAHYRLIPTLRDYLVVFSDQMRVQHYARQDDGSWLERVWFRPHDIVELTGTTAHLTLREVYKRIEFPAETTSRTPRLV